MELPDSTPELHGSETCLDRHMVESSYLLASSGGRRAANGGIPMLIPPICLAVLAMQSETPSFETTGRAGNRTFHYGMFSQLAE